MLRRLGIVGLLTTVLAGPVSSAAGAPDPVACTGYPQPRVYLEDQSWLSPQMGPQSHPGTGKQGYVTIGTCFPLYQHFGGTGTIGFDIVVRLHNIPGRVDYLRVDARDEYKHEVTPSPNWRCPTTDCERSFHVDYPLDRLQYSGLRAIQFEALVHNENDKYSYTLPLWPLFLDNGKPPPPPGSTPAKISAVAAERGVAADSWYAQASPHGKHAQVAMKQADFPWDPASGQDILKAGVWTPTIFFEKDTGFAYVDSALRANPPSRGTVIYEGPGKSWGPGGYNKLRIDTTTLSEGPHELLIGTCNEGPIDAVHCGALNLRFVVDNQPDSPAAGALSDTSRPVLSALSLSAKRFRAARSMRNRARAAARLGTRISYRLSEDAAVKFRLERAIPGRRSHGRCVKPKRAKRHARRCSRYKLLRGSFRHRGHEGMNQLKFKGRLRGRTQRPDRYRLRAVATDPAGNRSRSRTTRFRIVRR